MDLQIRYCTAADGVSIAYTTWGAGSGKPHLIHIGAFPFSDLRLWETFTPVLHACLTRHWTVTTYDGRGTGRSQREVSDFSLDAMLRDLDAVIAAVGAARPSLMAHGFRAHVGLAYAADRPDRVERLIIDNGDETSMPRAEGFRALAAADWDLFLDAFASRSMSWSDTKSKNFADVLRANVTPAVALAYYQASVDINVSGRLPAIEAPTLILLPDSASTRPQSEVQRFVSAIPNAVLVSIDTDALWLPEDECVAAIEAFIGSTGDHHAPHAMGGTAVILFTDIADSTSLTERMGDAAFRAASRALDDGLRAAIRESGGSPVEGKLLGDGVMATFASAAQAIDAARRCVALSAESELRLHIGLHAGDVIGEGDNVYGGAVNIAARICGLCEPGEILVSQTVLRPRAHVGRRGVRGPRRARPQGHRGCRAGVRGALNRDAGAPEGASSRVVGGVSPEVWDPGAVLHLPGGMTLNSANVIKQYLRGAVGAYRERELVIDDLIADGQTLATRWTFRGIPTREMFGVPPSGGRTITITGMDFYRASGGKLVEEWFEAGMFDVLRQLGVLPA